jgi:hypothetical protein
VLGGAGGAGPPAFGVTLPTNDLLWWVPFGMILWQAWRERSPDARAAGMERP